MDSFGAFQPRETQSDWKQDLDNVQTRIEGGRSLAQVSKLLIRALDASTASRSYCLQMPFMDNIIEALSMDADPEDMRTALLVCLKISKSYKIEHNDALEERGVIERAALLVQGLGASLKDAGLELATIQSYIELSLLLLANLVEGSKARSDKLLGLSIVEPVKHILTSSLDDNTSLVTACLSLISEIMSKSGPIRSIVDIAVDLLLSSPDEDILSRALILLLEFQQTSGGSLHLASRDGLVSSVIDLMDFYQPFGVLAPALRLLETWATVSPAILEVYIHSGLLESLIALAPSYSSLVSEGAFAVLSKLCRVDINVKHCIKRGILNDTLKFVASSRANTPEKREACALVMECLINCSSLSPSYFPRIVMAPHFMPVFVEIMIHSTGIQASHANVFLRKIINLGLELGRQVYNSDSATEITEPCNPYLDFLYAKLGAQLELMDENGDDFNLPLLTAFRVFESIGIILPQ